MHLGVKPFAHLKVRKTDLCDLFFQVTEDIALSTITLAVSQNQLMKPSQAKVSSILGPKKQRAARILVN